MPRRILMPSARTSMVSTTRTDPSVRSVTSLAKARISSRAAAGRARARTSAKAVRRRASIASVVPSEFYRGRLALGFVVELEILRLGEAEGVGDNIGRERINLDVYVPDRAIVVAAGHLDLVLGGAQGLLEFEEGGVGLEVRIGLGHCQQATQRTREFAFGLGAGFGARGSGAGGSGARLNHGFERLALMAH